MIASKSISKIWNLGFKIVVCIIIGIIASNALAAQATLTWDPNTESDLGGYKVHYGTTNGSYTVHTDVHKVTTHTVTGLTAGQTYYFAATAYDTSGNESGYSNTVSYAVPGATEAPTTPASGYYLNSGGGSYTDGQGQVYGVDQNFSGGNVWAVSNAIDGTVDDLLYQSERWGEFSYAIPLANGNYTVVLKFAEIYFEAAGERVFDVWMEGQKVIANLDIYSQVGKNRAYDVVLPVGVVDGVLNIQFSKIVDDPKLSAIVVKGGGAKPQNQAPTANAGIDQTVNAAAMVSLSGTGMDPENGTLTYQWRQTGGTSVTMSNVTSARASFAAPSIATGTATLTFELRVTDAAGLSTVDTLTVAVLSPDIDGDGVPNSQDAFPTNPAEWKDSNGNGIGDNAEAAAAPLKLAPDAPLLVSPVNDVVSVMAVLKTGAFRTTVTGSTHAKSRWQVFRDDDHVCVLDVQSTTALTLLTVPKLVLEEGTEYYWRAQFTDSMGKISEWSADGHFTTETTSADLNANGIPDAQEVASTVDLDRDGVMDNKQPQIIKSIKMEGTSVRIGVSIKGCPTCIGVESVESEDARQLDSYAYGKPNSMPFALINFKIAVAKPGDQAVVKLYFSKAASYSSKWYKYDPIDDRWYDFSAYAKFAFDRRSVTLTLRDGGPGDADGVANGVIVDPAGIVEVQDDIVMFRARSRALRQGLRRE